jgi:hypothetical protein
MRDSPFDESHRPAQTTQTVSATCLYIMQSVGETCASVFCLLHERWLQPGRCSRYVCSAAGIVLYEGMTLKQPGMW